MGRDGCKRRYAVGVPLYAPHSRVFVDESKAKGYYLAATAVVPGEIAAINKALRQLTRAGQDRIHFKKESDSSRRKLLSQFCTLELSVAVYATRGLPDKEARERCLIALATDAAEAEVDLLMLERDESLVKADKRILRETLIRLDCRTPRYDHAVPTAHPVLWVSDAVAWCYQAGGDWWRRAQPLVSGVRRLS